MGSRGTVLEPAPPYLRRRLAVLGVLVVLAGGVALIAGGGGPSRAADPELGRLSDQVAAEWRKLQVPDGRFRDPVSRIPANGYASALIGYSMLLSGDGDTQRAGLRAIRFAVQQNELQRGVFDQLVLARGYNYARRHLKDDPLFRELRGAWEHKLASSRPVYIRPGPWKRCQLSDVCFTNHELVEAIADVELLATGIAGDTPDAKLSSRQALERATRRTLGVGIDTAEGTAARSAEQRGLGILADTGPYPLGYHVLSSAMLALGIEAHPDRVPARARVVLRRALDTMAAYEGPDGDLAYVGARHEQVWVLAAAVYAGRAGARIFGPRSAAGERYEAAGERALARLRALHPLEDGGLRIVPRPNTGHSYRGVDGSQVVSNSLALFFLREASRLPKGPASSIPADRSGHWFVDPAHNRFAVRRSGDLWYAVHAQTRFPADPKRIPDQRYDFGLVRLKQRTADGWRDLIPPRPWTTTQAVDSAGPTLLSSGQLGYPWGERIDVTRTGIVVDGGFRTRAGAWLRRGVRFRYEPGGRTLTTTWAGLAGDVFGVRVWAQPGEYRRRPGSVSLADSTVTTAPPVQTWTAAPNFYSCCAPELHVISGRIPLAAPGRVAWRIAGRG